MLPRADDFNDVGARWKGEECLGGHRNMLSALRYYWAAAKGYRLCPWKSPYIRWRMETFFGGQTAALDACSFFRLLWRERAQLHRFLRWVEERRREQRARWT